MEAAVVGTCVVSGLLGWTIVVVALWLGGFDGWLVHPGSHGWLALRCDWWLGSIWWFMVDASRCFGFVTL